MVESASKQFIGLFIKHFVEDLITYQQQNNYIYHSKSIRNHHSDILAAKRTPKKQQTTKRKRPFNRASSRPHLDEPKTDRLADPIIIVVGQQPKQEQPSANNNSNNNAHHERHASWRRHFSVTSLMPKYNKLNLKYFSSRKTAKRLRYLLSLDAKKKPR